jgi:adenylate kinase family enzyme
VRIGIIGNAGCGKSTLARELQEKFGLARLDLDTVAWEPGQVAVPRDPVAADSEVALFCASYANWVVEGCYASLLQTALRSSTLLLFMEPGVQTCLANCRSRPWEAHKYQSKLQQDQKLEFLLAWVESYYSRDDNQSLLAHQALYNGYPGPKCKLTGRVAAQQLADLLAVS